MNKRIYKNNKFRCKFKKSRTIKHYITSLSFWLFIKLNCHSIFVLKCFIFDIYSTKKHLGLKKFLFSTLVSEKLHLRVKLIKDSKSDSTQIYNLMF